MARQKKKTKKRNVVRTRLIIAGVVLAGLAGIGFTFMKIYERGLKREALFDKAQKAALKDNFVDAIRYAKEALKSEPDNKNAKELLIHALVKNEQVDEARDTARRFLEEDDGNHFAAIALCNIAMHEGDFDEAERYARRIADRKPAVAYRLIGFIQDLRGITAHDWQTRLQAAATMRNLASLSEQDSIKAEALLVAATIMLELAADHPNPAALRERARIDLKHATAAAGRGRQADRSFNYDLAMGRIRVLSADEDEAEFGAKALRHFTTGVLRSEHAIAALAKYHLARAEYGETLDLMRELKGTYLWNRVYWCLRRVDRPEMALKALDASPHTAQAERALMRADLLLQGDDERSRQEAYGMLTKLVRERKGHSSRVLRALLMLATRFDVEAARTVAEETGLDQSDDPKVMAFLASLYAGEEESQARGLELAKRLATATGGVESKDVMRILSSSSTTAFQGYLEAKIEGAGDDALQHRLQRAFLYATRARREKDEAKRAELFARAKADVVAIRDDENAGKSTLSLAFNLASLLGELETAGVLLGRAATMDGEPEVVDVHVVQYLADRPLEEASLRLAAGVREVAAKADAAKYLEAFARAIETHVSQPAELIEQLVEAAREPASQAPALELAARIATGTGQLDVAAALARTTLEAAPGRDTVRELVGAIALRREAFDEVFALWPDFDQATEIGCRQVVGALTLKGDKDAALEKARLQLRRFPASADAHILVAQIYLERGEKRKALSVLSISPMSVLVAHMRAELLLEFDDLTMAEQLYVGLLVNSSYGDLSAWLGLLRALGLPRRNPDFTVLAGKVLKSKVQLTDHVRGTLHYLRGLSLEQNGSLSAALDDYEASIALDGNAWHALNNAAWHIATLQPARIATARKYIDRARELRPADVAIMDTAAEVYSVAGDHDAALVMIDTVLAKGPEAKVAKYTVHKARLFLRKGSVADARALLESVLETWPEDPAVSAAKDVLLEIDSKSRENEKVETELLPELPPEKQDQPAVDHQVTPG